ncbi:MAG: 3'(2'),5'-bisphosphate nucleotidase [Crocinitomicaceae bacterium]|nr:3'(2'),5'-bisphosphate nucleotidase [Crocinitomicaceae bacterium]
MKSNQLLQLAKSAAILAGEEILKVYNKDFDVSYKEDESPLTIADKNANTVIEKMLLESKIPILSEEGRQVPFEERKNWDKLWIVDPLDGTKEFVKRNGEFTVNIALIENGSPVMGVIYVPVTNVLYYASEEGAFKESKNSIDKLPIVTDRQSFIAVGSRSHQSPETKAYFDSLINKHGKVEVISMGSSLKICLVAEGKADVYPRFAPTMEWDTAAGHAIANYANKKLIDYKTKNEMKYNREQLLNNWFIVS